MPTLDAFSTQLVRLVREMPDSDILALVRQQLESALSGTPVSVGAPRIPAKVAAVRPRTALAPSAAPAAKAGRRPRATPADRQALLATIERVVKGASGLSASQVAAAAGVPQPQAAAAIKELKQAKRIFQGGERRFARYAADAKKANAASLAARKGSA